MLCSAALLSRGSSAIRAGITLSQARPAARQMSSDSPLKQAVREAIPEMQRRTTVLKKEHGNTVLGEYTVGQALGGMRGIIGLVYEPSLLDPEEGIRFRGLTIPDCQDQLPKSKIGGDEPLPEALLWLLMTGKVPTQEEANSVSASLASQSELPPHIDAMIRNFPKEVHPMSQFSAAISALNTESAFAKAYAEGIHKSKLWEPAFDDMITLMAKLPTLAATIYRQVYHDGKVAATDASLDWSANFSRQLGYTDPTFDDLMRLYMVIHSDHEGGNVSAHTTHLIASALSDPFLAFAGGMNGLAGPLHGLANQEVLRWIKDFKQGLGEAPYTNEQIRKQCWEVLNSGRVIPGYGHAVLRKTDPRFTAQRKFALKHMPEDPDVKLVGQLYEVVPDVLTEHGKTKNPWPNVDSHSGVLLQYYGMTEQNYYTVLFGVSRALGVLPAVVWDRALGSPIERPKSVTTSWLEAKLGITK